MRFYDIQVGGQHWTSIFNGINDPEALDVELDIEISPPGQVAAGSVKVYGIPYTLISQAFNFNDNPISVSVGFTNGLPLANDQVPHQGNIVNGTVWVTLGNWIANELSIEFIITPGGNVGGATSPKNIVHNMPVGTPLSQAIQNALTTAFPGFMVNVNINPVLVLTEPDQGFYQGLEQYQNYVKTLSESILGNATTTGYHGVTIDRSRANQINVYDGSIVGSTVVLAYEDLVGQPTWVGRNEIQIKTVMRGDISVGGAGGVTNVQLPANTLVTTNSSSFYKMFMTDGPLNAQQGNILNFQGTFMIKKIRHVGRFRQPTGEAWVTIINAATDFTPGGEGGFVANVSGLQTFTPSGAAPGSGGGIGQN
jgi:hypothetical protein